MYGKSSSATSTWISFGKTGESSRYMSFYCMEDIDATSDTTPKTLSIPYKIQVAAGSRQSSDAVIMRSVGASATLAA
jgi:hypothetical protein